MAQQSNCACITEPSSQRLLSLLRHYAGAAPNSARGAKHAPCRSESRSSRLFELSAWLGERDQVEASLIASQGYDIPVFTGLTGFRVWAEAGPPKGTLFNYPLRPAHHAKAIVPGAPAPPPIAAGIDAQWVLPKLAGRVTQAGMPIDNAIAETERDLAGIVAR